MPRAPYGLAQLGVWCAYGESFRRYVLSQGATIDLSRIYLSSIGRKENASRNELGQRESPRVLGMVTLNDIGRLEAESATGRGWIACTTDALFMEKPQYYDLIVDLTTSTPSKATRPSLYLSKPKSAASSSSLKSSGKKKAGWKLESVRYTWSDVRLASFF